MNPAPLSGRGIVITRPRDLAQGLAALVAGSGGVPILFPAIEIRDVEPASVAGAMAALETCDLAVFISPTAVQKATLLALGLRGARPWPQQLRVAAIGRGSRHALERLGLHRIVAPELIADSEALLALPEMQDMAGKQVLILRGEGGRQLLGDTLTARGAAVVHAECYRRVCPDADALPLIEAWSRGALHAITVTSGEGLANLARMLGEAGASLLRGVPVFVPHARVEGMARQSGVGEVRIAGPADEEMHAALVAYFAAAQ